MNIILISGFLGSGKTTFIRQLARFLVEEKNQLVVIIENEVGEIGIDDKFLSRAGFLVQELFGGCICCQLTGELTLAVNRLGEEYHPDWLIVETTGLAKPAAIIQTLRQYGQGIDRIFTLILADAGRLPELCQIMPELIGAQLAQADLVIVNKMDQVGNEDLPAIFAGIREFNAVAVILPLCSRQTISREVLEEVYDAASSSGG